jgi:SM-20-related protein
MALSVLNVDAVRQAQRSSEPYDWFLGSGILRQDAIDDLKRDFPDITKPGYLTVDEVQLKGTFKTLIDELESDEFSRELSKKFGIDLTPYPRLTTIMKRSQPKYGAIHTDGPSKVMTLLVYMNDEWQADASGRLRVLYNEKDFEPYAAEVPPTMGTVFAFLRADNSWHGHQPFVGERKVVQVAWVKDADELARKKKRIVNHSAPILSAMDPCLGRQA